MTSGKVCTRNKEKTSEWPGLFLNDLKTKKESLIFVKRMIAVAVSSITYLRGIFPEYAYRSRYLADMCIKVLHENGNTPGASKIVKWLMGSFDALEKQYLQVISIGVYTDPENPNCIIEAYQFNFKYTENGPEMNILRNKNVEMEVTLENTKQASVLLIRKLFLLMQNLDALPNKVYLTMKLYYYDDITPADYQPPGFKEGVYDHLWFEGMPVHFKVGEVHTSYHALRVQVSVEQSQVEKLQRRDYLNESGPVSVDEEKKASSKTIDTEGDFPSEDESAQFKKPAKPLQKRRATTKTLAMKKRRV